jgi:hypothetical protein
MSAGILLSILLFVRLLIIARGLDNDFTVDIPAGAQSCFFETIKTKSTEFEVEVKSLSKPLAIIKSRTNKRILSKIPALISFFKHLLPNRKFACNFTAE